MSETTIPQQPIFNLEKLYVKDLSLEIPHSPAIFLEREAPTMEFGLDSQAESIGDDRFEVLIKATVIAKLKEKTVFLIEAKHAGIFHIVNIPKDEMSHVLGIVCPNILYPYLRATITDISVRGGFAPVILSPFNFEVLRDQQKQQQMNQMQEQVPPTKH